MKEKIKTKIEIYKTQITTNMVKKINYMKKYNRIMQRKTVKRITTQLQTVTGCTWEQLLDGGCWM